MNVDPLAFNQTGRSGPSLKLFLFILTVSIGLLRLMANSFAADWQNVLPLRNQQLKML